MIYTCTFNPALDYKSEITHLEVGALNRTKNEYFEIGGKGIMVSKLLSNINKPSVALGFIAGFVGKYIKETIKKYPKITPKFIDVEGISRINLKLKHNSSETEINGSGPTISETEFSLLLKSISKIKKGDLLIISGTAPKGIETPYRRIAETCKRNKVQFVVDTCGQDLLDTLDSNPLLVKPNIEELSNLYEVSDSNSIKSASLDLIEKGARNVIVSLGKDGAEFYSNTNAYKCSAPKRKVINTTGSGDSLVAGFCAKYLEKQNTREAFKYSVACGSATAFSKRIATEDEITALLNEIVLEEL